MSDTLQITLGLIFLVTMFVLTRYVVAWRLRSAAQTIIQDLQNRQAVDVISAATLPYAMPNPTLIGMRNYHSKALEYMVSEGVVGRTDCGKYYLKTHSLRSAMSPSASTSEK